MKKEKFKYIIGVDEAGRGPFAGSVFVGAVLMLFKSGIKKRIRNSVKFGDSKKLNEEQREFWYKWIKDNNVSFSFSSSSVSVIDKINISRAADVAAKRAVLKLTKTLTGEKIKIVLDGTLAASVDYEMATFENMPKADEKFSAVSLASIVAKVLRDREMKRMGKLYPQYEFEKHKGYGTKKHIESLKKHGLCQIHRLTFIKKYNKINK